MIKKIASAILFFLILNINTTMLQARPFQNSKNVHLFNKVSLDGWYTFLKDRGRNNDPKGVFTVQDSVLRISGEEWGCITTEKEYDNYRLVVEFKWGEITFGNRLTRARDSGILIHSKGKDGAYSGTWMNSIECQVIEGGTGDFIVVGDGSDSFSLTSTIVRKEDGQPYWDVEGEPLSINKGRINWWGRDPLWQDSLGFRGKNDVEKEHGQWNRMECIAQGDSITVLLNGIVVNKATQVRPQRGRIQIQSEGAELFIRRVDLLPLSEDFRLIYNNDANYMFLDKGPGMTAEDLYGYVDKIASHGVTTFSMSPNWGQVMNYPTRVGEVIGDNLSDEMKSRVHSDAPVGSSERAIYNVRSLLDAGLDPLLLLFNRAHKNGMEAFLSFRLNEVHCVEEKDHYILSSFWKDHPEWHIGTPGDPLPQLYLDILGPGTSPIVAAWLPGGFDFSHAQVRSFRLAQLKECVERYDLDGLELDFQRFPMYFKPGCESEHAELMTRWLHEIRTMIDQVNATRDRKIEFGVRVMATPEQNEAIGLDPLEWARQNFVDFIIISHYLHNDFDLQFGEFRTALPDEVKLYASIEPEQSVSAYQKIAGKLWKQDIDGIQLFNFFCNKPSVQQDIFPALSKIGTPMLNYTISDLPAPVLKSENLVFTDELKIDFTCQSKDAVIHYTLDGSEPDQSSPVFSTPFSVNETVMLKAVAIKPNRSSKSECFLLKQMDYFPASTIKNSKNGLRFNCYHGSFSSLDEITFQNPDRKGICPNFDLSMQERDHDFAIDYSGFIDIPQDGFYSFYLTSNDGSRLSVNDKLVIDHDGLHGAVEKNCSIPLLKGKHPIAVHYFQQAGSSLLELQWKGPGIPREFIPNDRLVHQ